MVSILAADGHPVFRRGLRALLLAAGILNATETASGEEAISPPKRRDRTL